MLHGMVCLASAGQNGFSGIMDQRARARALSALRAASDSLTASSGNSREAAPGVGAVALALKLHKRDGFPQIGANMKAAGLLIAMALGIGLTPMPALAECNISDAKLEEAVLQKPELRDPANRQMVRDLRGLRDSAFVLWSYGRHEDCERLLASIRELVTSPSMGNLGDSDEDEAEQQFAAREPMVQRGGAAVGRRDDADARPLISINEMAPGLLADEIIGAEVRSSDDKIIGEVRNIVFGTKDPARLCNRRLGRVLPSRQGQHRRAYPRPEGFRGARELLSSADPG
jgi:hypothetical protein